MKNIIFATMLASVACFPNAQAAGDYPNRAITLLLPFAAGGGGDVLGRFLAEKMSKELGQTFVVENKPGAGGVIGTTAVARSAPDGYTITIGGMTTHLLAPITNPNVPYDPVKDFKPIGGIGNSSIVMLVSKDYPANNLADFKKLALESKNPLQYASWGQGSTGHFCGAILAQKAKIPLEHIPYKGTSDIINNMMGGHISVGFVDMATGTPPVQDGRLKAIALCTRPSPSMPKVASYGDQGIDFDRPLSWVMYAPAGTPDAIVKKLSGVLEGVLDQSAVKERLLSLGITPGFIASGEQHKTLVEDIAAWRAVAAEANITVN